MVHIYEPMGSRFPPPPPILRRRLAMRPSPPNYYDNYPQVSYPKPSGVVDIHSLDQLYSCFVASAENKLLVIEFKAKWCGPCKKIEPAMQELAAKNTDVEFIKIDVDNYKPVAQKFEVDRLPRFALVKKCAMVDGVEGFKLTELQSKIDEHRTPSFHKHGKLSSWY